MSRKFRNKYRIDSIRLTGFDYTRDGAYFVTICTKNNNCIFDEIVCESGNNVVSSINNDTLEHNDTLEYNVETGLRPVSTTKSTDATSVNPTTPTDATSVNMPKFPDGNFIDSKSQIKHIKTFPQGIIKNHKYSNARIHLSDFGKIVHDCWFDLPNHYPNIILDEFIIMPDHIHGIIIIKNDTGQKKNMDYLNLSGRLNHSLRER